MKQVKVTFLFLFLFTSCKKDIIKKNNIITSNSKVKNLFESTNYKKSNSNKRLDLSKKLVKQEKLNSLDSLSIFNNISFLYKKNNKVDSAIFFAKKMLNINFDILSNGNANYKLGSYFNYLNQKDSAFYYYNKAKKKYLEKKDSLQIGRSFLNIAIIESNFGAYASSDISAVNGLKYLNGKREKTIISLYNCLAINSKKQHLYNQAIYNYQKSIKYNLSKNQKLTIQNNIANVYKEQKNYPKSITILENLLKDSISNQKTKARIIDNLSNIKWLNDPKENVIKDLLLAESIRKKEKDSYGLIASYTHLSDYYKKVNKKQSLAYAEKAYQISKNLKSVTGQIESIDKIVELETPQKSIKYYQESIHLRDSIQQENTKRQYKFAKIKYNYEEEEKQKLKFEALATKNQLIAEQENNQKKNIIIIALLLTSGLVFLIYRRKQQNKKRVLQEKYKTETRIAKRLHDELGNGIYNAITKVLNPKFETEEIVQDLDKLYLQTRAISHENDSIETGVEFENYFRELVASYNSNSCKISLKGLPSLELSSLSAEKQIVLYRVFNELFVNMKKHSKATLVLISCKKIGNKLEMIYKDNGVGFRENMVVIKNGLKNMETRINSIQGTLNFDVQANNGFKATIRFKK